MRHRQLTWQPNVKGQHNCKGRHDDEAKEKWVSVSRFIVPTRKMRQGEQGRKRRLCLLSDTYSCSVKPAQPLIESLYFEVVRVNRSGFIFFKYCIESDE